MEEGVLGQTCGYIASGSRVRRGVGLRGAHESTEGSGGQFTKGLTKSRVLP